MELTSKQRAQLRGMANGLDTIVQIGKDGIGDNLVQQANEALEARELIKCRVLESAMLTAREAYQELAKACKRACRSQDQICTLSGKHREKAKIVLVKDRKKPTQT